MRTNHANVTEVAHLRTDLKKFQDNYNHIFNKKECECDECLGLTRMATREEIDAITLCKQQENTEVR